MNGNDMIFIIGVAIMCVGALFGICAAIVLKITGANLKKQLIEEYGPERRT